MRNKITGHGPSTGTQTGKVRVAQSRSGDTYRYTMGEGKILGRIAPAYRHPGSGDRAGAHSCAPAARRRRRIEGEPLGGHTLGGNAPVVWPGFRWNGLPFRGIRSGFRWNSDGSTAERNRLNSGARIARSASATPAPSSNSTARVSPSRRISLSASAALISGVRWDCECRQTAS